MNNAYLQNDFENQKMKFYKQQLFDNNHPLKKAICWFYLYMLVYYIVESYAIFPRDMTLVDNSSIITTIVGLFICFASYYISIFKFFEKNGKKIFRIRYCLMVLSVTLFAISVAAYMYTQGIKKIASNDPDKWFYLIFLARKEGWINLIIDILVPVWYIKLVIPLSIWIAFGLVYYHSGLLYKSVLWNYFITSMVYLTVIWGIKAYSEWKSFLAKTNAEAWNGVHEYIINKVPDAIAIVDERNEVFYSNPNFKHLCENSMKLLSQKLSQIRRLGSSGTMSNIDTSRLPNRNEQREDEESPKNSASKLEELNFSNLIQSVLLPITKGTVDSDEYQIFSANFTSDPSSGLDPQSFEIKVKPLLEYNKVIVILNNTTQRDLAVSLTMANHYKDKLLATVSHDLRAPINGSISFIETSLQHEEVPSFIKDQFLIPAQRSCQFLLHLVNDIIDFSQINAHKLRMNYESMSIVDTIENCHQLLEMQARFKGIDFPLTIDPKIPKRITTDHNRVAQIVTNLLSNAIKFTSKGQVRLSVEMTEESSIMIQVTDTGIGIKEQDQNKLFKEFTRIDYEQKGMNAQGVGLGLVIANNLAGRLCDERAKKKGIHFTSTYGQGSSFWFFLDDKDQGQTTTGLSKALQNTHLDKELKDSNYEMDSPREENYFEARMSEFDTLDNFNSSHHHHHRSSNRVFVKSRQPSQSPLLRKKSLYGATSGHLYTHENQNQGRVLIVDDNPINILALQSILNQYNINTDSAMNGQDAISKVVQNDQHANDFNALLIDDRSADLHSAGIAKKFGIIFMDLEMPEMDGFVTTGKLTEMMRNKELSNTPIVGYSGHVEEEILEKCLGSGMVDVISKPPDMKKLRSLLKKYMNV